MARKVGNWNAKESEIGMKYQLNFDQDAGQVKVTFRTDLENYSGTVSARLRGSDESYLPVIDMNSREFFESLFRIGRDPHCHS